MPDIVNSIVGKLQERFADATSTTLLDYINRVHREVVGVIPEIARHTLDITTLAAGTAHYDLPADTIEVAQALYLSDANTAAKLVRTSEDKLIAEQPTWEFDSEDTPAQFYVQGNNTPSAVSSLSIYLYPKPDTSTSSGYPRLRCYITEYKSLTGTDSLPEGLASYDVYLEGASYYMSERKPAWVRIRMRVRVFPQRGL